MLEREFSLGGVKWGHETSGIIVETADFGSFSVRSQDKENSDGWGSVPGQDTAGTATWVWNCFSNTATLREALDTHRRIAGVWRREYPRGTYAELSMRVGGADQVVYGRPRRITTPSPDEAAKQGVALWTMDFEVLDPRVYDSAWSTLRLQQLESVSSAGLSFPHMMDNTFIFGTVGEAQRRRGQVTVGGETGAPYRVTLHGPGTNLMVSGGGLYARVPGTLAYDRSITIDTRLATATWDNGANAASSLSYDTRLRDELPPGDTEFFLSGADATLSAYADISWRNAHYGL